MLRHIKHNRLLDEISVSDIPELVALLRPTLRRIERGELQISLTGASVDPREAGAFQARFPELVTLLLVARH